ncbi:MAG TPA: hypothetical protein VEA59_04330 [Patescibacteria group bacterium]|nr:hypothetical protein [Patescibacteria group bacterium]
MQYTVVRDGKGFGLQDQAGVLYKLLAFNLPQHFRIVGQGFEVTLTNQVTGEQRVISVNDQTDFYITSHRRTSRPNGKVRNTFRHRMRMFNGDGSEFISLAHLLGRNLQAV